MPLSSPVQQSSESEANRIWQEKEIGCIQAETGDIRPSLFPDTCPCGRIPESVTTDDPKINRQLQQVSRAY